MKGQLDRLFLDCLKKLEEAKEAAKKKGQEVELAELEGEEVDTEAYVPDVDLAQEFASLLREKASMQEAPARELAATMVAQARYYFTVERKRQNILGEGFEDLLWLLATRVSGVPSDAIRLRKKADALPGFAAQHTRERIEKPDLAFVLAGRTDRLVSVKWSIRQDRQKQWSDELDCYAALLSQPVAPKFQLVTNEYDPGRLLNAFALSSRRQLPLDCIYHVNLGLLKVALSDHPTWKSVKQHAEAGRLRSLEQWLRELQGTYHPRQKKP